MQKVHTYQLKWIAAGILLVELVFWVLFVLVHDELGYTLWGEQVEVKAEQMRYEHPELLVGLFAVPVVIVLFFSYLIARNRYRNAHFSDRLQESLLPRVSGLHQFMRFFWLRNALACLIIAMANPQFGSKKVTGQAEQIELIVALDISRSMLVLDMDQRYSRLQAAKNGINQLINQLHGDKIGLVIFAGGAYPQLALTNDYGAAKSFVNEVSTDMISNQGTNIPAALELALRSFSQDPLPKVVLLITDGENHEGEVEPYMAQLQEMGIILHVVGMGSNRGGPIPLPEGGFRKDDQGNIVISKPNPELIKQLAKQGGGNYVMETKAFPNFKPLIESIDNLDRSVADQSSFKVTEQRGPFFALLALISLAIGLVWKTSPWNLMRTSKPKKG
jgi:Ca-activated chloride channel homolog